MANVSPKVVFGMTFDVGAQKIDSTTGPWDAFSHLKRCGR